MKILVTGGTGFLGQHLVRALQTDGHDVSFLGRDFTRAQLLLQAGARPIVADLRDQAAIRQACEGIEVVYHVGALSAAWGKREDFYGSNVEGTRAVINGALAHGVRRLVYVSSPAVIFTGHDTHKASDDLPYPQRFTSLYALTKKLGEDLVNAAASRMETVILRPKAIFGPGDRTLLPRLVATARRGRLPQIGAGHNLVDLTYVENVVYALKLALHPSMGTGPYTITNDEHVPLWDMIRQVLRELGLSAHLRQIPIPVALTSAALMEARATLTKQEPLLTRYTVNLLGRTQTYDISAARRDLGYSPRVSVAEGIRRTIETLRVEI